MFVWYYGRPALFEGKGEGVDLGERGSGGTGKRGGGKTAVGMQYMRAK